MVRFHRVVNPAALQASTIKKLTAKKLQSKMTIKIWAKREPVRYGPGELRARRKQVSDHSAQSHLQLEEKPKQTDDTSKFSAQQSAPDETQRVSAQIIDPPREEVAIKQIARHRSRDHSKLRALQKSVLIGIEDRIGVVIKFGAIHVACGARCQGVRAACNA